MCWKGSSLMCVKCVLLCLNVIFILIGLSSIVIASWALFWPQIFLDIMGPHLLRISAYSTISIGGVILLLSILGCTGAALENRCILVTFFTLLCGLFMACLVIGTLATVFRRDLIILMVNRMSIAVQQDYGNSDFWTELLDLLQSRLKCCAVEDNQADLYLRSVWYSRQIHQSSVFGTNSIRLLSQEYDNNLGIPSVVNVPMSCCVYSLETKEFSNRTACQIGSLKSNLNPYLNPHGCANVIIALLYQYFIPLIIMVVILAVLMMAGLILGLLLLRSFSMDDYPEINLRENV
ncbi:unnamed protein product [Schistosoma intercalatum]|nr:unnamed protein product [Schistosoma intercalatum]CAH8565114.1 unnamed protein product [Schistosoma intercalatum]